MSVIAGLYPVVCKQPLCELIGENYKLMKFGSCGQAVLLTIYPI